MTRVTACKAAFCVLSDVVLSAIRSPVMRLSGGYWGMVYYAYALKLLRTQSFFFANREFLCAWQSKGLAAFCPFLPLNCRVPGGISDLNGVTKER